jgi:hypothetical protein
LQWRILNPLALEKYILKLKKLKVRNLLKYLCIISLKAEVGLSYIVSSVYITFSDDPKFKLDHNNLYKKYVVAENNDGKWFELSGQIDPNKVEILENSLANSGTQEWTFNKLEILNEDRKGEICVFI